jgi:hypothetical protein
VKNIEKTNFLISFTFLIANDILVQLFQNEENTTATTKTPTATASTTTEAPSKYKLFVCFCLKDMITFE